MNAASTAVARALLVLLLWAFASLAWALGEVATVASVTGTASAQGADGTMRSIAKNSSLFPGDIIQTEKGSAVNLQFSDGGKIALRHNTRFIIESYRYDLLKPAEDNLVFRLLKGGLRSLTGLVGKRNPDAYQAKTATATIGIRGTDWAGWLCGENDADCAKLEVPKAMRNAQGNPPAGLYLTVFEGTIYAANRSGSKDFPADKSGYVKDQDTLPIELEQDPGLGKEFLGFLGLSDLFNPFDANPSVCLVK